MTSRTVKSPAGADVEIVEDANWIATAGVSDRSLRMWARSKPLVVRELWEHGPVENASGSAVRDLWERIENHYPQDIAEFGEPDSLNSLVKDATNAAAFHRVTNAKRTYHIELIAMPEIWYEKLQWDIGESYANVCRHSR